MALVPVRKRTRGDLGRLHEEMDDLLSGFFHGWDMPFFERSHWPAIDIADNENEYLVKAEVPGCKAEDIDISVHGNTLTVSGEKKQSEERKEKDCYHVESSYGTFRRELNIPSEVDAAKIEASCKDGILTIKLPKVKKAKAIKIKIKEQ